MPLRRDEAQLEISYALGEPLRKLHGGVAIRQDLVLFPEPVDLRLARADLLAELVNLILLQHVADAGAADERAEQDSLERRDEPDGPRLVATIVSHDCGGVAREA